ncbi:hypothetical protein [Streptomyces sp. NPDC002537]
MRVVLGGCGLALMGVGAWILLFGVDAQDPWEVAKWLIGMLLVHDAVVVPLTLAVGLVVARVPGRRALRGTLLVAAALTAVAIPPLLRPGPTQNSSVLPLDYVRNWALCLAATAVAGALAATWSRWRRKRG